MKPDQVIVVDNNSTDNTVKIASSYPFVSVVSEKKQGIVHARNAGFNANKCDIIGRIDADSRLHKDWVSTVKSFFNENSETAAITGNCYFYDFPLKRFTQRLHHFAYYTLQGVIAGTPILWGSNMAVRSSAWEETKNQCLTSMNVHEDIDLSLHLKENNFEIARLPSLVAEVSLRRGNLGPLSIIRYLLPWPKTYQENGYNLKAAAIFGLLFVIWIVVLPFSIAVSLAAKLARGLSPKKPKTI